jgi:phage shock protein PspC (stress-responsive transcriptional regulator)
MGSQAGGAARERCVAILFIFAGAGLLVYVLLWIFVPSK